MTNCTHLASEKVEGFWLDDPVHRVWLKSDAQSQFEFFKSSMRPEGGFHLLDWHGNPLATDLQELHSTTRLVHSYALGHQFGVAGADDMIDQGMSYLFNAHRDQTFGGYFWSCDSAGSVDDKKLAYGHVFVLLAGASAKMAGHPKANELIEDVTTILNDRFWEEDVGLFADEWNRDWTPFSTYRGMNANMHAVEALLTAFEATGQAEYLEKAGRILEFFIGRIAPDYDWRLPEHYDAQWRVDLAYVGNPMFRPNGTTPGHSFELTRLHLQHWDLAGRPDTGAPQAARRIMETALRDAWSEEGGFFYTLDAQGQPAIRDRYWWPVTEAIGVLAAFIKLERNPADEYWYRHVWRFAHDHFVDHDAGGWFHELDADGRAIEALFAGKGDIYHALQADLFPLARGISRLDLSAT
ncbi:AGE family epimerase/isomerase [Cognatiyoonia sp.]|uniref:AGE family epimerase/isomerase n=1 Tax=Cognatiyoonia sp. TaxID=2211652 RepID=UPI003F6A26BB